ncbi:hypothetical protein KAS24_01995, partial [Candidatus Bathyarchaeota archaeon]|nr:hypothetical protein [Candidatus Bathyarchaeota archaeon]
TKTLNVNTFRLFNHQFSAQLLQPHGYRRRNIGYTVLIVREKHKDSAEQLFYMNGTQQQTMKSKSL